MAHLFGFLCGVLAFAIAPIAASAQDVRTVVLDVRGGGTELLVAEIESIEVTEVKQQAWFAEQVRARNMKPARLLSRAADLRHVMSGSNISWVIHVTNEDGPYEGRVYGVDGKLAESIGLGGEFAEIEAAKVGVMFAKLLGIETSTIVLSEEAEEETEPPEDAETTVAATKEVRERKEYNEVQGGLDIRLGGRLFKREHTFAGANNAVVNFVSAFYPGGALDVRYALDSVKLGSGLLGGRVAADVGADRIETDAAFSTILHLDATVAALWVFDGIELQLGARHTRYSLAFQDIFPSLAYTVVVVGLSAERRLGAFCFGGNIEAHPWGMYGAKAASLFGEGSSVFGVASGIMVGTWLTDAIALRASYRFRLARSSFPGDGTLDFNDTRGVELVHGPEFGIGLRL